MKHTFTTLLASAIAALAAAGTAHAAGSWAATQTLRHADPAAAMQAPMKPGEAVHVALALQPRDKAGLDALVESLVSGRATRHLTPAEFLAKHAPSQADVQAVVDHLTRSGFRNVRVGANRMLVSADGTAAAARTAFDADLRHFTVDGRDAYANVTDARVPERLAHVVGSVLGLQDVSRMKSMKRTLSPQATGERLPHDAHDFASLYGGDSLPTAAQSTLAIVTVGNLYETLNDLQSFAQLNGWPAVNTEVVQPAGEADDFVDVEEWNMDSQASLGAAGGQVGQMLFYDVPDYSDASLLAAFNAAVSEARAPTISVSIGGCEQFTFASGFNAAADTIFEIGIAQGQTFAFSSGDYGSWQCSGQYNGLAYPAVSPWVMAIGGTTLATKNDLVTYVGEKGWSCTSRLTCAAFGGSGGGASATERVPSWQVGVVGRKGLAKTRHIPDVSFDADPLTGLNLFIGGHIDGTIGGTSLSAPIFAGLWSRIQAAHGNTLGFPGMGLYGLHETDASVFHDVTIGVNGGYKAKAGWDDVTGFGSFDAAKLSAFIDANPGAFGH